MSGKSLAADIKIIGVEPEDAASMTTAVRGGKRQTLDQVGIFADGVAVKMPGELTFELIKQHVDDFVTVSTDEICAAMKDLFDDTRAIADPPARSPPPAAKNGRHNKTRKT